MSRIHHHKIDEGVRRVKFARDDLVGLDLYNTINLRPKENDIVWHVNSFISVRQPTDWAEASFNMINKASICCLDNFSGEVCCLGARTRDIIKMLPSLVKPEYYNPFLLFHLGLNEDAMRRPCNIRRDFISLGKMLEGLGAQVVFSIPPVGVWDPKEGDKWTRCMTGCVDGVMLMVLDSTISDRLLRDWACWYQMGMPDQVWQDYCGQQASWTY